jgi:cyclin-dependent kinase 10
MGELLSHAPLMPGTGELEQLQFMVRLLGTPNERIWADFPLLPASSQIANLYQPYNNLSVRLPNVSHGSLRLLDQLLTYDPAKRLNARQALAHSSFTQSPLPQDSSALPTFPINCHRTATTAAMAANKEEYRVAKRKLDDILPRAAEVNASAASTAAALGFDDEF